MTIEDQIKNEKLQYDINREAAKISALSSGKIDKYEYLTGEEILTSNRQQIFEQVKFTYSPLGKAFEKQTKTIEDQGEKQIKAIQDKSIEKIKKYSDYDNDYKKELLISKEREIFRDIYNYRLDQIQYASNNINYNNLNYEVIGSGDEYKFDGLKDPLVLLNNIKKSKITIQEAKNTQKEYNKYLNFIRKGNKNNTQRETFNNINNLCNARDMAIKFIEDYASMILETKRIARQEGEGLKILTPNQMLKRLPIALTQIKAGNNSERLLNEIRQIVYSLYRSKEITRKVYNNIIKSIKV